MRDDAFSEYRKVFGCALLTILALFILTITRNAGVLLGFLGQECIHARDIKGDTLRLMFFLFRYCDSTVVISCRDFFFDSNKARLRGTIVIALLITRLQTTVDILPKVASKSDNSGEVQSWYG